MIIKVFYHFKISLLLQQEIVILLDSFHIALHCCSISTGTFIFAAVKLCTLYSYDNDLSTFSLVAFMIYQSMICCQ